MREINLKAAMCLYRHLRVSLRTDRDSSSVLRLTALKMTPEIYFGTHGSDNYTFKIL